MRGRACYPGANPQHLAPDPLGSFFSRLIRSAQAGIQDAQQAARFADALEQYQDDDLPWRLTNLDEHGLLRLREAAVLGEIRTLTRILAVVIAERWAKLKFAGAVRGCVRQLWATPDLMERLTKAVADRAVHAPADLQTLAEFGLAVATAPYGRGEAANLPLDDLAKALIEAGRLSAPPAAAAVHFAQRLRALLTGGGAATGSVATDRPGGRHSNDPTNFREISIVPTVDEALSQHRPFLPLPTPGEAFLRDDPETQLLDRQFRLLREDFLAPLRDAVAGEVDQPPFRVQVKGVETQARMVVDRTGPFDQFEPKARTGIGPIGVRFEIQLRRGGSKALHELVRSGDAKKGALLLLLHPYPPDQLATAAPTPLAFGRVIRPPTEEPQDDDRTCWELSASFDDHTLVLRERGWMPLLLVAQSFFAYEPILAALQKTVTLPFREELLGEGGDSPPPAYPGAERVLACIERNLTADGLQLDVAQRAAFEHACSHRVANIVGPPGTGKTFVGVELAHAILQTSKQQLLVVCYTNHALDQFLEAMIDKKGWGVPKVARLGIKSKNETLSKYCVWERVREQRPDNADRKRVWQLRNLQERLRGDLETLGERVRALSPQFVFPRWSEVRVWLEQMRPDLLAQLSMPPVDEDGFRLVGGPDHLWQRWKTGNDPGDTLVHWEHMPLWQLDLAARRAMAGRWLEEMAEEAKKLFMASARKYDELNTELESMRAQTVERVLTEARLIGATTTGAAKYKHLLRGVGVLLIEEAGEVLEAHSIAAMGGGVQHAISIGDHKQLRPKVHTHGLTVAGGPYALNRSLFERLVLGGAAHAMLSTQHRMRPEISRIAREMTYNQLIDAEAVAARPHVRSRHAAFRCPRPCSSRRLSYFR